MAHPASRLDSEVGARNAVLPGPIVAVTVVIPTLNAAARLADALESVWFANEVLVVGAGPRADTVAIARAPGPRVLAAAQTTSGEQRNVGIGAARNEWILAL